MEKIRSETFVQVHGKFQIAIVAHFNAFFSLNVYGDDCEITKEECIDNVSKRLSTALLKVKKDNTGIGGRGKGKLTKNKIERMACYYKRAIKNNTSVVDMQRAIFAIPYHSVSTDENPQHSFCPDGEESWCF
jgi:hypothetical protein